MGQAKGMERNMVGVGKYLVAFALVTIILHFLAHRSK
jgi:hypothetical protein